MNKRYSISLFIFRRDLRLFDNTGLNAALQQSEKVIACFIFDPRQIDVHPYQSRPGLQFMLASLRDLQLQMQRQSGQLDLFCGCPERIVIQLHRSHRIQAVFVNRDYTPFARQRDADLLKTCEELGVAFHDTRDILLNEPESVRKEDGSPYQVFTAFYRKARLIPVENPQKLMSGRFIQAEARGEDFITPLERNHSWSIEGGRSADLLQLDRLANCQQYAEKHDFPALPVSSGLSAYLKFGCCSIREAYWAVMIALGEQHPLLRQFYWRDFFTHIAFHFPHVFGYAFNRRYEGIVWRNDDKAFLAWQEGRTGFPIVDAGMRQLRQTACMPNRVRMIAASFLVKDLLVDWRWGERHFAQHLLDYDPCVNNGNWQWVASTGCDAQPYFRIFNPWLQQKKFDMDCLYIKRWLPELRPFSNRVIHSWYKNTPDCDYPSPIVEHRLRSEQCKTMFQLALKN